MVAGRVDGELAARVPFPQRRQQHEGPCGKDGRRAMGMHIRICTSLGCTMATEQAARPDGFAASFVLCSGGKSAAAG